MIERREHLRLALEARQPIGIVGEGPGSRTLIATSRSSLRVARAIDLAHSPGAEGRDDLVRAEAAAGRKRHGRVVGLSADLAAEVWVEKPADA